MSQISESTVHLIDAIRSHADVYTHASDGDHTNMGGRGAYTSPVRPDARITHQVFAAILRRMAMADRTMKYTPITRISPTTEEAEYEIGGGNIYMSPLIADESVSPFLSDDVRSEIVTKHHPYNTTFFHYTWSIPIEGQQPRDVDLYLSYPDDAVPVSEAVVFERVRLIFIWLQIAVPLSRHNCSNHLRICMYFTNVLKQAPSDDHLEYTHVNSAVARTCPFDNTHDNQADIRDICLFREEEWFKVFVHETFHCLGFDFSGISSNALSRVNDEMRNAYPILASSTSVNLFEMYCETWAGILNILMIVFAVPRNTNNPGNGVFVRNNNKNNTPKRQTNKRRNQRPITRRRRFFAGQFHAESIAREAFQLLEHEIAFCGLQAVKVLNLFGKITPRQIWLQKPTTSTTTMRTPHSQFHTNTSAFSYFILRSFVLRRFCEFVAWCSNHQPPNSVLLPFRIAWTTPGVLDEFILRFVIHPFYSSSIIGIESNDDDINNNNNSGTDFPRLSHVEAKDHVAFLTRMAGTLRKIQQLRPTENTTMFLHSMRMTLYSIS